MTQIKDIYELLGLLLLALALSFIFWSGVPAALIGAFLVYAGNAGGKP